MAFQFSEKEAREREQRFRIALNHGRRNNWTRSDVAKGLGVSLATVQRWAKKLGMVRK